eukprot:c35471_g1_i1 orf=93-380(+)
MSSLNILPHILFVSLFIVMYAAAHETAESVPSLEPEEQHALMKENQTQDVESEQVSSKEEVETISDFWFQRDYSSAEKTPSGSTPKRGRTPSKPS